MWHGLSEDSAPGSHDTTEGCQNQRQRKFPEILSDDLQPLTLVDTEFKADDVIISVTVSQSKGMRWQNLSLTRFSGHLTWRDNTPGGEYDEAEKTIVYG